MDGTLARALLGVPTNATSDLIRRAFRVAAFDAHPDQGGDGLRFRQLVAARDLLLPAAPDFPPPARRTDRFVRATHTLPTPTFDELDERRPVPSQSTRPAASTTFDEVLARVMAA